VRWIAGKTDGKVAADLSDNVLRDAFRARKTGGSSALRDAERASCEACFPAGSQVATPHGDHISYRQLAHRRPGAGRGPSDGQGRG